MFTDIVGSTNLLETLGDEAWEDVMRWHNETLRTVIELARAARWCRDRRRVLRDVRGRGAARRRARWTIQRRLADHRRAHGFAPQVRIGLHAAEATIVADDYTGIGVHQAARVGAMAEGGEILVTRETVDAEPIPFPVTDERTVSLKGLAQPVGVASVDWRPA